jgi:hypothetical protein
MSKLKSYLKETEWELKSTYNVPSGAISVILVFYYCHKISRCPLKVSSQEQHLGCFRRNLPCVGKRFLWFHWMVAEWHNKKAVFLWFYILYLFNIMYHLYTAQVCRWKPSPADISMLHKVLGT